MDFQSLPTSAASILAMKWPDYEPYYQELEARQLKEENLQSWLNDWSQLAATVDEQYWRLYIATTVDTADKQVEEQYNK
jgi:oligoendopeptidase F